jgi:tRNA threonylcarbamoyladenosine biosynthesis protein TsaB
VSDLLARAGWKAGDIPAVVLSRGPGRYTGLRVGIMSAKTFAYATGARLIAVDTFDVIARQAPRDVTQLAVLADAQQDKIYVQSFARAHSEADLQANGALVIRYFADWLAALEPSVWVSGPGLEHLAGRLPTQFRTVSNELWLPQLETLLALGSARMEKGQMDDLWVVEPLYLRPSAAEEKWPANS